MTSDTWSNPKSKMIRPMTPQKLEKGKRLYSKKWRQRRDLSKQDNRLKFNDQLENSGEIIGEEKIIAIPVNRISEHRKLCPLTNPRENESMKRSEITTCVSGA